MIATVETLKKPPIRWAGGKQWLTKRINDFIPSKFNNYHEPFLGGAAMFLFLNPTKTCFLSDINFELINFYKQVRDNLSLVIKELKPYKDEEEYYYKVRSKTFDDNVKQAARFFYLNKTNFNGLYRVNQNGIYNVPYGKRNLKSIVDLDELENLKQKLDKKTRLSACDFSISLKKVKKGDLVFLDPPYTVAHNNNGFIEYNQDIFSWTDQERLRDAIEEIVSKKAYFILTNAVHNSILNLYKGIGKKYEIERYSTISGHMKDRKKVSELIITNCI